MRCRSQNNAHKNSQRKLRAYLAGRELTKKCLLDYSVVSIFWEEDKDKKAAAQRLEGAAANKDRTKTTIAEPIPKEETGEKEDEAQRPEGAAAPQGRKATTTSEPDRAKGKAAQCPEGAAAKRTDSAA